MSGCGRFEYGLFVARSSIGTGPGVWNFFDFFEFVSRLTISRVCAMKTKSMSGNMF